MSYNDIGGEDMNWTKAIMDSIDYIEKNLSQELKVKEIAKVAMVSPFYYQRMFQILTGSTVHEYIRNRRLSLAASELILTDTRVLDLAIKYGYESSEAFSRAFKKVHGVNPTVLRKREVSIKSYPRLVIEISLKGAESMDYRIEKKDGFSFYGMTRGFTSENGDNFVKIPKFWEEVLENGLYQKMISQVENPIELGVCMPMNSDDESKFDYVIGAMSNKEVEGYDFYHVPAAEWAVFELRGPIDEVLQDTWKRIFSEWFPSVEFKHANLPEFEVYLGNQGQVDPNAEDYYMEIWIPIEAS